MVVMLASPVFAQFPGEPKAPPSYDPVADMTYNFARGAPNEIVREAQRVLRDLGYYTDEIDGIMGPEVKTAIWNFQKATGLTRSASLDRPTMVALGLTGAEAAYASPPSLGAETTSPRHLDDIEAP
jgi:peptidoglycan hydrolase-like protein with peptidoglycan-binding domain